MRVSWPERRSMLLSRRASAVELTVESLQRLEAASHLNCLITVCGDRALRQARRLDRALREDRTPGLLLGVEVVIKDNINVAGVPLTGGSEALTPRLPRRSAPAALALERAGAIVLGKANLHELACGSPHPAFPAPISPIRPHLATSGSSSGSAAAIAWRLCDGALGTDTGGSIRVPAALCGVVGMKPTRSLISAGGVLPVSRTLDHVGPLADRVSTLAALVGAITALRPPDSGSNLGRLGIADPDTLELDPETDRAYRLLVRRLRREFQTRMVRLPDPSVALATARIIIGFEAARDLLPRLTRPDRLGPTTKERLQAGARVSQTDYEAALREVRTLRVELDNLFDTVAAIVTPSVAVSALEREATTVDISGQTFQLRDALGRFTTPWNIGGHPAVVQPFGNHALPASVQIVSRRGDDALALEWATRLEERVARFE